MWLRLWAFILALYPSLTFMFIFFSYNCGTTDTIPCFYPCGKSSSVTAVPQVKWHWTYNIQHSDGWKNTSLTCIRSDVSQQLRYNVWLLGHNTMKSDRYTEVRGTYCLHLLPWILSTQKSKDQNINYSENLLIWTG